MTGTVTLATVLAILCIGFSTNTGADVAPCCLTEAFINQTWYYLSSDEVAIKAESPTMFYQRKFPRREGDMLEKRTARYDCVAMDKVNICGTNFFFKTTTKLQFPTDIHFNKTLTPPKTDMKDANYCMRLFVNEKQNLIRIFGGTVSVKGGLTCNMIASSRVLTMANSPHSDGGW